MGIDRDESHASAHAAVEIVGFLLSPSEGEQRGNVRVRELVATLVEPIAELGGVVEMKSIEQRSGVESGDTVGCIGVDCRAQIEQVAIRLRRIEEQAIAG